MFSGEERDILVGAAAAAGLHQPAECEHGGAGDRAERDGGGEQGVQHPHLAPAGHRAPAPRAPGRHLGHRPQEAAHRVHVHPRQRPRRLLVCGVPGPEAGQRAARSVEGDLEQQQNVTQVEKQEVSYSEGDRSQFK